MTRPPRWYGVELKAPRQATRRVTVRARTSGRAERLAELRNDGFIATRVWPIRPGLDRNHATTQRRGS